MSKMKANT